MTDLFDITKWHFFDISFASFNLFSYMLGMTAAFFNQGLFGKKIAGPIFLYFGCLALYYALMYHGILQSFLKDIGIH